MKKFKNTMETVIQLPTGELPLSNAYISTIVGEKDVVVFSPHLDDAVLSMGSFISQILKNGNKVTVISIFTEGTDLSSQSIQIMLKRAHFHDAKRYFKQRKIEDVAALTELGANVEVQHLDLVDAAWRSKNNTLLYPSNQLTEVHFLDGDIYTKLHSIMKKLLDATTDVAVFAPLALGKHVDHTLTRDAAISVFPQAFFYEDFPYSTLYSDEDQFIRNNNLVGLEWGGDYQTKKNAILKYATQAESLFTKWTMVLPYEKYYMNTSQLVQSS